MRETQLEVYFQHEVKDVLAQSTREHQIMVKLSHTTVTVSSSFFQHCHAVDHLPLCLLIPSILLYHSNCEHVLLHYILEPPLHGSSIFNILCSVYPLSFLTAISDCPP